MYSFNSKVLRCHTIENNIKNKIKIFGRSIDLVKTLPVVNK